MSKIQKYCKECGKLFLARDIRQNYCKGPHFRPCPVCGKLVEVKNTCLSDPPRACSKECALKRKQQTCLDKYGCVDPGNSEAAKAKRRQTCLERYGVDNPSKLPETVNKIKQTCLDRYGVSSGSDTASSKLKVAEAWKNKSEAELAEIAQKRKSAWLSKYGVDNPLRSEEIKQKVKDTNLVKYGNPCAMQGKEIREKINQTFIEKYGSVEFWKNPEIIQKRIETCRNRYGCDYAIASKEVRAAAKQTMINKYGVDSPMHSKEFSNKVKQTTIERHGVWPVFLREDVMEQVAEDRRGKRISKTQQNFCDMLEAAGLHTAQEFVLDRKMYDIHVEDTNILVEIDPSYTHSQQENVYHQILDKYYHRDKTKIASDNGYRCIHVFDWDDRNKVLKTILPPSRRIFARNCKLHMLSLQTTNTFLNENHLQGGLATQLVCAGLYDNDELVCVMTFGPARYSKKYQWELLRYANKQDCSVVGGASKLFKFFLKEFEPESIISYCDLAKFSGNLYKKLGMNFVKNAEPARVWSKDNKKITDNLLRQRGYDQLFKTNYGKGTSNEELMIQNGWRSVYDCGQSVWEWTR